MIGEPDPSAQRDNGEAPEDAELGRALETYLANIEAGRPADPARLIAAHPKIAGQLRACLQVMNLADRMVSASSSASGVHRPMARLDSTSMGRGQSGLTTLGSGSVPNVHLRDLPDETEPLIQPRSTEMPVPNGTSLGRYQLQGEIARGGMGAILKGRDVDLGRDLAIKVLLESHQNNPEIVSRFIEEAQIGGQLQHPGIAPVYELGTFPDPDRRPYFAMKLIRGQTLAALLGERPSRAASSDVGAGSVRRADRRPEPSPTGTPSIAPLPDLPRFLAIFEQVCQTMAYAHARGVIHRDLKPSNVMVGSFGEVQVMDWGLAKVLPRGGIADEASAQAVQETVVMTVRSGSTVSSAESQAGSVLGTPAYMSPEQARGELDRIDERADVFALGAILCETLTGRPPYMGSTREEIRGKAARGDLGEALSRLDASGAEAELTGLARSCLAVVLEERPRNASDVSRRLTAYLAGVQERLRAAELARVEAQATAVEERKRRRLAVALAAAILATAGLAGGGWAFLARQRLERAALFNQAAAEAEALYDEAKRTGDDMARWHGARASAHAVERLLADAPDKRRRSDMTRLVADVTGSAAAAENDHILLARLLDVRCGDHEDQDFSMVDEEYADAFRTAGIDVVALGPSESGAKIATRPLAVRIALASALDHWALVRASLQGDPGTARSLTEAATIADPDQWRVRLRGLLQIPAMKERRKALDEFAESTPLDKLPAASAELLGTLLDGVGDRETAERVLRAGQRAYPGDFSLNFALAQCLAGSGRREDDAIRFYMAARALRPEAGHALAHAMERNGESDQALALFRDLVRVRPKAGLRLTCLGELLQTLGRNDEAAAVLQAAVAADRSEIQRNPGSASAHGDLGFALLLLGKPHEAVAELHELASRRPNDCIVRYKLGLALYHTGKLDEAIDAHRAVLRIRPRFQMNRYQLAKALAAKGKMVEAKTEFRAAIRVNPDNYGAHETFGIALCDVAHDFEAAVAELQTAVRLRPDLASFHFNLGIALTGAGRTNEAVAAIRTGLSLDPDSAKAHSCLGRALAGQGNFGEAVVEYRTALRLDPVNLEHRIGLGTVLAALNKFEEAIAEYRTVLRVKPEFTDAHIHLGNALSDQGKLDEAIAEFRAALRIKPGHSGAHNNLGIALRDQGRFDEAITEFRAAVRLKPDYAEAHCNLGQALRQQGHFVEALAELERGHELGSKSPNWRYPSAQWVRETERMVVLDRKLPAILSGREKRADAADSLALAQMCYNKKLHAASARLWAEALQAQPILADDMNLQNRYNAACAAALAASGQGKDDPPADDAKRTHWRNQAVDWLKADLAAWSKILESGPPQARQAITQTLQHWKADTDLAGLRDAAALAKLSGDEQKACRALWAEVDALLAKAQNAHPKSAR